MNNIERYELLIKTALEIQQLKIELKRKFEKINRNITGYELINREFDDDGARKAFAILAGDTIKIEQLKYVKSEVIFKDVEIYLHSEPDKLKGNAMKEIFKGLRNKEIWDL